MDEKYTKKDLNLKGIRALGDQLKINDLGEGGGVGDDDKEELDFDIPGDAWVDF